MKTNETWSNFLLFFALILCGACSKDEVTNPSVFEVRVNGVVTPVEHGTVILSTFYGGSNNAQDTIPQIMRLSFHTNSEEFISYFHAYQVGPFAHLKAGVYPDAYKSSGRPCSHLVSVAGKKVITPVTVANSQFEINSIMPDVSRISLTFSYQVVRGIGDSVPVSGRLVNVPYTNTRWEP